MKLSKNVPDWAPEPYSTLIATLLNDDAAVKDLQTVLQGFKKSLNAARANPATPPRLRDVFNDVADVMPVAETVLQRKGKLSFVDVAKAGATVLPKMSGLQEARHVLMRAMIDKDPAAVQVIQSTLQDPAVAEALRRLVPKVMPPEIQVLLKDKETAKDVGVILSAAEKELEAARKNPAAGAQVKEAFDDISFAIAGMRAYIETGDVSSELIMSVGLNLHKYMQSAETLQKAYESGDPAVMGPAQAFGDNEDMRQAFRRIVPKVDGSLIKREKAANGDVYGVVYIFGKPSGLSFKLDDIHQKQFRKNNKPPKGPQAV